MKKIFVFFLSFVMMFFSSFQKVNASAIITGSAAINLLKSATEEFLATSSPSTQETITMINDYLQAGGFMSKVATVAAPQATGLIKYLATQIDSTQDTKTEQENIACIKESLEHVEFLLDDIKIPDDLRSALVETKNYYVNENKYYYGYSLDLQYYDLPADINTFVQDNDDQLVFLKRHYNGYFVFTDNTLNSNNFGFVYNSKGTEVYDTIPYSLNTFNRYTRGNPGYNNPYEDGVTVYFWQNGVFTHVTHRTGNYNTAYENFYFMERDYTYRFTDFDIPDWTNAWNCLCVSYGHVKEIPIYGTKSLLESSERGTMPYYYNNTVWQDFSQSTGDYTFSPNNINTVTYGDTVSYVSDYHGTHNEYPDNSTINNWITTTNNNNTSGGGSGGDDSGGSGGDGDMSIFDFLSKLGEVLGGLIKNLGNMLTSLIEGIVSVITDLLTSIPDTMNTLIGAVFGWMPTELKALFALGISLMVLVGLIRLFKG